MRLTSKPPLMIHSSPTLRHALLLLLCFLYSTLAQVIPIAPSSAATATLAPSATSTGIFIPSSAPAGGLTVTQPEQTAAASYYKIAPAVNVTFGWNFTSVLSYGTSLTIQAFCSGNANTYTLTTIPATATQVVWNPYSFSVANVARGSAALVQETYRLQIFDERGLYAGISPGLMSPNDKTKFALYIPQSYTPLADGWTCSGCTSAVSDLRSSPVLFSLVAVVVTMFLSGWSICSRGRAGVKVPSLSC